MGESSVPSEISEHWPKHIEVDFCGSIQTEIDLREAAKNIPRGEWGDAQKIWDVNNFKIVL